MTLSNQKGILVRIKAGDKVMTEAMRAEGGEAMRVPEVHEIELALEWQQTSIERDAHYTAASETFAGAVGCIYRVSASHDQGGWAWAMIADDHEISRNCGRPMSGIERSARQAAREVERSWFAAIRGTTHDRPPQARNSYAKAKGRNAGA